MDFSTKPTVACYFFRDLYGVLVVKRLWQGVEYLGLPGDEINMTESFGEHARKLIAPGRKGECDIAMILDQGLVHWSHLGGNEDYQWKGRPAAINVFSFPESKIVAPMTSGATRIMMDQLMGEFHPTFDVTLMVLRQLLRQHNSVMTAAA